MPIFNFLGVRNVEILLENPQISHPNNLSLEVTFMVPANVKPYSEDPFVAIMLQFCNYFIHFLSRCNKNMSMIYFCIIEEHF